MTVLYNSRGNEIILNAVTKSTFRGPPIVAFSSDYTLTFNAAAWTNLQTLVDLLDVPVFHIDQVHDGGSSMLLAILRTGLQRFYSAQASEPWIHSSGADNTQYPPAGPIFYFDGTSPNPSTDDPGSGGYLADQFSRSCVNFRRNHLYEHAQDSIWPVAGENLDRIQRPPIHGLYNQFASDPTWFVRATYQNWLTGSVGNNYQRSMRTGIDILNLHEGSYPGISRHVLPSMAGNSQPFIYPWST